MSILFKPNGEFRCVILYVPAVILFGFLANLYTPMVDVIWDMVFFKQMAFALHDISTFNIKHSFPVQPLYPLFLSIGCFAPDYRSIEFIQSWLNPAMYFFTLFPLYRLSRLLLNPRESAWVCLLFIFYPSTIFTQWSMSENLAAPLTLWMIAEAATLLLAERPSWKHSALLGLAISAMILTRILLIVICLAALAWLAYRFLKRGQELRIVALAGGVAFTLVMIIWWQMGYLSHEESWPVYANFTSITAEKAIPLFFTIFCAQWTGLWLDGALVPIALLLTAVVRIGVKPKDISPAQLEMVKMFFFISLIYISSVAGYYVKRTDFERWSVNLRYVFYINILCLPLAVSTAAWLRKRTVRPLWLPWLIFVLAALLPSLGFFMHDLWDKITDPHAYFSNAPTLDFIYQIRAKPIQSASFFFGCTLALGTLCLTTRRLGWLCLCGVMLYVQLCTFDFYFQLQKQTLHNWWVNDIHAFCRELEDGHWNELPIYCEEEYESQYLVPNLWYWLNQKSTALSPAAPRPPKPYLLFTPHPHDDGTLDFKSGDLHAYVMQ